MILYHHYFDIGSGKDNFRENHYTGYRFFCLGRKRTKLLAICPKFWAQASMDGTVEKLAGLMDTQPMGLMGISTCNDTDDWKYYIAVASTKEKGEFEEFIIPESTWAVFYEEGPITKMQELESRIVSEWLPTSGYEYANAPDVELYLNPDPDNAKYEVWIPIVKKEK